CRDSPVRWSGSRTEFLLVAAFASFVAAGAWRSNGHAQYWVWPGGRSRSLHPCALDRYLCCALALLTGIFVAPLCSCILPEGFLRFWPVKEATAQPWYLYEGSYAQAT